MLEETNRREFVKLSGAALAGAATGWSTTGHASMMDGAPSLKNQLTTYPAPQESLLNTDFTVKVRTLGQSWQDVSVYLVKVDAVRGTTHTPLDTSMAYFDFSGTVDVSITHNKGNVESVRVRPLSYGVIPQVKGDTIAFSLSQPRNLSVEVNGEIFHNLQLFANPVEASTPDPKNPDVMYYGPGIHEV